jgi:hypothetical protein
MPRFVVALVAIAVGLPAVRAADTLPEGNWRLSQMGNATFESPLCLLKVEEKDGKLTAAIVDTLELPPSKKGDKTRKLEVKLESFKAEGSHVQVVIDVQGSKMTFDGQVEGKDAKVVRGTLGDERRVGRGLLTRQDAEKLERIARLTPPEPYAAANKLSNAPFLIRNQAQKSKDVDEKADLLAKAKAAAKEAEEKVPPLYMETVAKHADSTFAVDAASQLLRTAGKLKAQPADVETWIKLIDADAAKYGPRFARETTIGTAETLNVQKGYEATALAEALRGADRVAEKMTLHVQARALRALRTAQTAAGEDQDAKRTAETLAKVDAILDDEYIRTVPPFKPEKFAGRKDSAANRPVVMELFTGAQCPPCVAADAAFDALEMTYVPKDLILIQYHVHIPGPDPMTNPDTVARWDFYTKKFEEEMGGVPSTLFNGKPQEGGGGPMSNAEPKFKAYTKLISGLLDDKTDIKVTGAAKRAGDKVTMEVGVEGVKVSGDKARLRVLVVEEKVKFAGGNGMRFHHRVVRAMPGGAAGIELTDKSLKKTFDLDLAELRKVLNKYLDEYAAKERPFPYTERPMDMKHLKVIALVQDDSTAEILTAAEFDVEGK